jgi:hypothetical protein
MLPAFPRILEYGYVLKDWRFGSKRQGNTRHVIRNTLRDTAGILFRNSPVMSARSGPPARLYPFQQTVRPDVVKYFHIPLTNQSIEIYNSVPVFTCTALVSE